MAHHKATRHYLFDMLKDQDGFSLPPGPVLPSPTTFLSALIAEVITDPSVQKSKTIDGVFEVVRGNSNTKIDDIVMGAYGNKVTDTEAYTRSGIPRDKIWIVDPEGVVINQGTRETTSYGEQATNVDILYPKIY